MTNDWRCTVAWLSLAEPRLEHVTIWRGLRGFAAHGRLASVDAGRPVFARYRLDLDEDWRTRRLQAVWRSAGESARRVRLRRDADSAWHDVAGPRPDLAGCLAVDLAWTPLTNTLPIRSLGLAAGEQREITVAYVAPDLSVLPDGQRYTRLGPQRWRFDSLDSDFTAEMTVDGEGLVVDYPPLFRRVGRWPG